MAYDVFIRPLNADIKQRMDIKVWFRFGDFPYQHNTLFPNKFVVRECGGELDYYGVFNKLELLEIGKNYANRAKLPNTLAKYLNQVETGQISEHWMEKHHYKLIDYLQAFNDDDKFHIDAIYWESGMF